MYLAGSPGAHEEKAGHFVRSAQDLRPDEGIEHPAHSVLDLGMEEDIGHHLCATGYVGWGSSARSVGYPRAEKGRAGRRVCSAVDLRVKGGADERLVLLAGGLTQSRSHSYRSCPPAGYRPWSQCPEPQLPSR